MQQLVKKLDKKLKRELAALLGIGKAFNGVFKYRPIDEPRALYDGFGALGTAAGTTRMRRQRHHRAAGDADPRDVRRVRAGRLQRVSAGTR